VNFGISNTSTATYGATNFSKNTTYLIIVKHSIVTGTTADPLSMWVIPSGMPAVETAAGTAEVVNTTTNGTDAISAIGLRQGSTTSTQVVVDAIRVGTSWTSVVPASASAPSVQVSDISFNNTGTSSTDLSWTNGNGNGRIVKINTSNSFTAPVSGSNPSAVSYTGTGEAVVYNGNGSSTTTSGLLPGSTYHFRAYEYDNAGYLYNTATATGNPNSITINYPAPVANSLSPASASAGASSFTLTVSGSVFYPASVINWNGSPRTTTYVNGTTLTASIPGTDIATAGSATVTVTNPLPGGGTSTGLIFAINASSSPLISVNASLNTFTTQVGTPSAAQSYTVSGSNLTDDITVTPPVGFEIRTGSNPFSTAPVVLSAGTGSSSATEYTVTVDLKDASHPNFGTGFPSGYLLNGVQGPVLTLVRGTTYKFYFDGQGTCCSSTLGHPFIFTSSAVGGGANSGDVISTGVIQYGDSTFFTPDATTPSSLYYMCDVHQSMGSSIIVIDPVVGSVASTTIDIRFNPASSGAVVDSVEHSSAGATTQWLSVTGFAIQSEPAQASAISFGTISGNSIEVNTSGGDGAKRIIVIRQGSAVNFTPTDAVAVSGVNSSFTTASDQGAGNKVVYNGTGNTVTVTGLSALTTYHFAVFEYNGTGNTSNYNSTAGLANATTLSAEPGTAATITLSRLKTDTAVTALSSGTGTSRLVVLSTSPVSFVPVDGTPYSGASAALGTAADLGSGNLLVFNAAIASPLTLTGLSAGTTYYLRSFEYNGSGSSINYRTSTTGNLNFTTPSNLGYNGGVYTQDFNGLPSATGSFGMTGFKWGPYYLSTPTVNGTNLTGWQHANTGGTSADLVFAVDNGSSTSGGSKSYGVTGSSNRALGSLATGSAVPAFGLVLVNNTAGPLTTVSLNYTGQQWRNGGSGTPNQLLFSYQIGGTDISNGTFTTESSLNFNNPISGGAAVALNGTLPANQLAISSTFQLSNNWLPGQTLVIRWTDVNDSGNDEGMAIDDLTFSAQGPVAPVHQDSAISFLNVTTTGLDVNWLSGDGSNRIVKMNTSNSFTNPVDGQDYTANAVYSGSGEQVVYNGNGNVVHVDGLTAGTTYFFRVYAYNGSAASAVYNTSTATDNPASQTTVAASSATQLAIISINGGADPSDGVPFSVLIQSQDALGNPQTVSTATTVTLSVASGVGTLGGTVSGIIPIGGSSVTILGVTYSPEDFFVELTAAASGGQTLSPGTSAQFNVLGVATQLSFVSLPASGIVNQSIPNFQVQAYRGDFTLDPLFTGAITVSKLSGPGSLSGTLTVNAIAGTATFSGISFSQPGTYELQASATGLASAFSTTITITLVPSLTELVVPKYISGKTSASAHNARMPFAVCLKIDNLVPNTAYDIRAGVGTDTTANTTYGSGNVWLGTFFGSGTIANAFTTNANGSSGPFWIYIQPTANSTNSRFAAGFNHNLRIGFAPTGGLMPLEPNFIGSKLMKALDIGPNSQSPSTTDDGAFLKGSSGICLSGKYILVYDNATGTGDPMFSYQARQMIATNTSQSDLPASINDVLSQGGSSALGDYVALVPTGANNSNGVRRIEARNADNTLFNAATDADGVWSGGANTTTLAYRGIATVTNT
ncbi:MAG: beta strand repeat-containing protein, partial [Bacteroidota bacterium]